MPNRANANFGYMPARCGQTRPALDDLGPRLANCGQVLPKSDQFRPNLADLGRTWPTLAQPRQLWRAYAPSLPELAEHRPSLGSPGIRGGTFEQLWGSCWATLALAENARGNCSRWVARHRSPIVGKLNYPCHDAASRGPPPPSQWKCESSGAHTILESHMSVCIGNRGIL